jgi:hypothetical protein
MTGQDRESVLMTQCGSVEVGGRWWVEREEACKLARCGVWLLEAHEAHEALALETAKK